MFSTIRAGMHHTCGTTVDGIAYCWRDNDLESAGIIFYVARTDEYRDQPIIGPMRDHLEITQAHRAEVAKRTGCVTNLTNAGVPMLQTKEWTVHTGLGVHDRYFVVSRQSLAAAGERYSELLTA